MATEKISIDFGNLYTNIFKTGSGVVLSEPTVAAVDITGKGAFKAFGFEAKKLIGKTAENTKIVFPVFEGEIVNEDVAVELLSYFLNKIEIKKKFVSVESVIGVPCGSNSSMIEKYEKVALRAGINKVYFVESPILAALGQKIPLTNSAPCFIIDMAGGVTNIAALSYDGIIAGISVNFGANKISVDIIDYIADVYGLQIGLLTAERLKKEIASLELNDGLTCVVNGRDIKTGAPRAVSVKAMDILEPVKIYYDKIAELAMSVLIKLPPEVSAEIRHSGIYVSGIASDVYGLKKYYSDKLGMKINVSENSSLCNAIGGGTIISDEKLLKRLCIKKF